MIKYNEHLLKNNNYNSLKMGYFSQRKKRERENLFMVISLSLIAIIYCILLFDIQNCQVIDFLRGWQFHFYLFNAFLLLYTLFRTKFLYSFIAVILLVFNYASLAKTARLFFNEASENTQFFEITYQKGEQNYNILLNSQEYVIFRSGKIDLSPNIKATFISLKKLDKPLTIVNIDFSKAPKVELSIAFNNLAQFVEGQDEPIIVVGDFQVPSWTPLFRKFLLKTELKVKNHVILSDGHQAFKFFVIPAINILGFDNVSLKQLTYTPDSKSFYIKLTF